MKLCPSSSINKPYVYSDIRNVCWDMNDEAKAAFLSVYGAFDEREAVIDNAASVLRALIVACGRQDFPDWTKGNLEKVKDGSLLTAVEGLLEQTK